MGPFGYPSTPNDAPTAAGAKSGPSVVDGWAPIFGPAAKSQNPAGQSQPPRVASGGNGLRRVRANPNSPYPAIDNSISPYAIFLGNGPHPLPLSSPWNAWGMSPGSASSPPVATTRPTPNEGHLFHTGSQPLDYGLNFMSGAGNPVWQTLKGTGDFLYNNAPPGGIVGLADAVGLVKNLPPYVPDAWRADKPLFKLGQALATHPGQVWQGAQQAAGNELNSLVQSDPGERAYAQGQAFGNLSMGLMGLADPADLVGAVGDLGKIGETAEALEAARAAKVAKYMGQGFDLAQAKYLAEPYEGMGHHLFPRRGIDVHDSISQLPFVPKKITLPRAISDSRFNVLKPNGISRGDFYELHYKVDPHYYGSGLPRRFGSGGWSGRRLGLDEYDTLGRLWHGSPTSLKMAVGGAAINAGRGASWLANQQDWSGTTPDNTVWSPVDDTNNLPAPVPGPQDPVHPSADSPVTSSASGNGDLPSADVWPPWDSGATANNPVALSVDDINNLTAPVSQDSVNPTADGPVTSSASDNDDMATADVWPPWESGD